MKYKFRVLIGYIFAVTIAFSMMMLLKLTNISRLIFFIQPETFRYGFYPTLIGLALIIFDGVLVALICDFPLRMKTLIEVRNGKLNLLPKNETIFVVLSLVVKDFVFLLISRQPMSIGLIVMNGMSNILLVYLYQRWLEGKYLWHVSIAFALRLIVSSLYL